MLSADGCSVEVYLAPAVSFRAKVIVQSDSARRSSLIPMGLDLTQPEVEAIQPRDSLPHQGSLKSKLLWLLLFVVLCFGAYRLRYDLRSYSLLIHFLDPQASGPLLRWETNAVTTQEVTLPTANGPVRARMYVPSGVAHPPGLIVLHGMHHLGIDEPRRLGFQRASAGARSA